LPGEARSYTAVISYGSAFDPTDISVTDPHSSPRRASKTGTETIAVEEPRTPGEPVFSSWSLLNTPICKGLFHEGVTLRAVACLVLCGLWSAAIWSYFGGAITRIAAVQLATGERIGAAAAMRHAAAKWPSYFFAPLLPVGGVLLATIPVFVVGLIMQFSLGVNLGVLLAGVVWPLVLAASLFMALLLLGVLFGWPLMWATISTEGTDSFDALSSSYAYTFHRPLQYLFYAAVASVIGGLGWLLVQNFAAGVVWMGYWAASWGGGDARIHAIMGDPNSLKGLGWAGAKLIHLWTGCVKLLAVGYLFSYFWTASSSIYFLLRRDVDATEMDEVFLDADASEPAAGLPPIKTDEVGAPVVGDNASAPATNEGDGESSAPAVDSQPE
jgi:hypothetical protein